MAIKISEYPANLSETYTVKFWYRNSEGFLRQIEEDVYSNSKNAHSQVEKFAKKNIGKFYKDFKIISVTYN